LFETFRPDGDARAIAIALRIHPIVGAPVQARFERGWRNRRVFGGGFSAPDEIRTHKIHGKKSGGQNQPPATTHTSLFYSLIFRSRDRKRSGVILESNFGHEQRQQRDAFWNFREHDVLMRRVRPFAYRAQTIKRRHT